MTYCRSKLTSLRSKMDEFDIYLLYCHWLLLTSTTNVPVLFSNSTIPLVESQLPAYSHPLHVSHVFISTCTKVVTCLLYALHPVRLHYQIVHAKKPNIPLSQIPISTLKNTDSTVSWKAEEGLPPTSQFHKSIV